MSIIVHVVGTGTIGEPLIAALADYASEFGIDEVSFHKRTPMIEERQGQRPCQSWGRCSPLTRTAGVLVRGDGLVPKLGTMEAIERATVVIDCTPAGNANKVEFYVRTRAARLPAQVPSLASARCDAWGPTTRRSTTIFDRYIQVVAWRTHNISVLI